MSLPIPKDIGKVVEAAKSVLDVFEHVYPEDKRPRNAIEATEKYIAEPTEENKNLAKECALFARDAAQMAYYENVTMTHAIIYTSAANAANAAANLAKVVASNSVEAAANAMSNSMDSAKHVTDSREAIKQAIKEKAENGK